MTVEEVKTEKLQNINTIAEVKVYNDIIDQVYNVYLCHLMMDSPKEKFYKVKVSKKEYDSYKRQFDQYLKTFDKMLDTSKIIAFCIRLTQFFKSKFKPLFSRFGFY
ncbi:MAG: hypothetical protein IPJ37_17505 [Bacteroidales bacterium]|nr:hypothetical protein [Bacteroidales bacterium]